MSVRWILQNGRGRVLLMLDNLKDKEGLLARLSGTPALNSPDPVDVFHALLLSNVALEKEMALSDQRGPYGEGGQA
jgi:hypothetical protein